MRQQAQYQNPCTILNIIYYTHAMTWLNICCEKCQLVKSHIIQIEITSVSRSFHVELFKKEYVAGKTHTEEEEFKIIIYLLT